MSHKLTRVERIYMRNYMRKKRAANPPVFKTEAVNTAVAIREMVKMNDEQLKLITAVAMSLYGERTGGRK